MYEVQDHIQDAFRACTGGIPRNYSIEATRFEPSCLNPQSRPYRPLEEEPLRNLLLKAPMLPTWVVL